MDFPLIMDTMPSRTLDSSPLARGVSRAMPVEDPAQTVGEVIRARRRERGMSQELLADLVGIRQPYLSQIELGKVGVPREYRRLFPLFADALRLPVAELFEAAGLVVEVRRSETRVPLMERIPTTAAELARLLERGTDLPTVGVAAEDLQGARSPFGYEMPEDCEGFRVYRGDTLICDVPAGRMPRDRQLVVVLLEGRHLDLVRWCCTPRGQIELRDGYEHVVRTLDHAEDIDVLAFYLTFKPGPR